ncbi:RNA polymerase-associated protein RapA [Rodentibacter caecimuris]|uniref:RNA polymerase-associated protein RapA n=1 Tax=Rodentibacter caecimuris TaxID=1796644 RepID=A0ABX3KVR9_9PAST|nr:RNA polymerase-binding ATPase [Rodentibacter heylii]
MQFVLGQRWLSESENTLGLGILTEFNQRSVSLYFPAADETRIYSVAQAPIIRVIFSKGDLITYQENQTGKILEVQNLNGLVFYLVKNTDAQEIIVNETELSPLISLSSAKERLFSSQLDRSEHFALRYRSLCQQQAQFQSPLRGLRGVRANLIPHQLHIAAEVGNRIQPRVLLADEVGLGKTVEAGMILQNLLFAEKVHRVLILVPESLQHQWLVEMLRRFNLNFSLFDEERSTDFTANDGSAEMNPFSSESLIICALNWLTTQPKRAKQALQAQFDLLIVDEAHHLSWSEHQPSAEYILVEQLAQVIPSVLLLTATPNQLGQESHFARLRLLDPNRFYNYSAFLQEQQQYQPVAEAVQSLLQNHSLTVLEKQQITSLLSEQIATPLLEKLDSNLASEARHKLIQQLIDRHGTSRLLFRNTRQGIQGFPQRTYHPVQLEEDEQRTEWLISHLKTFPHEKVLVMCQLAQTTIQLEKILREKYGIYAALFHEKMSLIERDRAAAYFSDEENGAQILLSSSIGSEGRNFQFSNQLVLFDLPDNPDLLEQCIGRLDRIGQRRNVHIYLPYVVGSATQILAYWYHKGLNAFEETSPTNIVLFERFNSELQHCIDLQITEWQKNHSNLTALSFLETLIEQTRQAQRALQEQLEKGRDLLLELNSNGGQDALALAQSIAAEDNSQELINFATDLFDIIGVEQEDLGEQSLVISPTGTMLVPDFPGLKEEGITVTFNRELALQREEMVFLTWDHPIIYQGIDLIASGNIGKAACALLINKHLPVGTLLLELVYIVESQSPKGLQLNRFLPPTPIRLLLDVKGDDLAKQVSFTSLQTKLKPLNRNLANQMIKKVRLVIEQLLEKGEKQVISQAKEIIHTAVQKADTHLSDELNRLIALQQVNKNIRPQEIECLTNIKRQSLQHLNQASWRLDSLRMIITNKE